MDTYLAFAKVYDRWMRNIPYHRWCRRILDILHTYEIDNGIIADLGCGSGRMTRKLAEAGYDMIGIDNSEEMLARAYEKSSRDSNILYLCQDIRAFELYGTVRAAICCCDTVNYMADEGELATLFRLVNNYLDPGGLFIFDIKTEKWFQTTAGLTSCRHDQKGDFFCETAMDQDVFEYHLSMFEREADGRYAKFEEYHYQKIFTKEAVCRALADAGLQLLAVTDGYSSRPGSDADHRLCFIAKECGKSHDCT